MNCQHRWLLCIRDMQEWDTCRLCDAEREFKPEATYWGARGRIKGNRNSVIARQTGGLVELAIKEAN